MSDGHDLGLVPPAPRHPRCPDCGAPMWLMRLDRPAPGDPAQDQLHYQCQVCHGHPALPPPAE